MRALSPQSLRCDRWGCADGYGQKRDTINVREFTAHCSATIFAYG